MKVWCYTIDKLIDLNTFYQLPGFTDDSTSIRLFSMDDNLGDIFYNSIRV